MNTIDEMSQFSPISHGCLRFNKICQTDTSNQMVKIEFGEKHCFVCSDVVFQPTTDARLCARINLHTIENEICCGNKRVTKVDRSQTTYLNVLSHLQAKHLLGKRMRFAYSANYVRHEERRRVSE